jgi:hypothetical protein
MRRDYGGYYLKRKRIRELRWPPKSPDLNPIENLWGIVKSKMKVTLNFTAGVEDGVEDHPAGRN